MADARARRRRGFRRLALLGAGASLLLPAASVPPVLAAGQFLPYTATAVGSAAEAVAIGDVTGDGRNDVVLTTSFANNPDADFHLFVFPQTTAGSLGMPMSYATAGGYTARPESVAIGDVNGDGRPDVVVGLDRSGIQAFYGRPDGTLGNGVFVASADSTKIRIGRFDNSGRDQVAGIGWGTDTLTIFADTGAGLVAASTYPVEHGGHDDLEVGDVTGDGRVDLVVMSGQLYADPNISVLAGQAAGTFGPPAEYRVAPNTLTDGIGVGDVTGDGRLDVVASYGGNRPDASIAVFAQAADGTLAAPVRSPSYDIPEPVDVADVDLDGRPDVVTLHGGWQQAGWYRQLSNGTLAAEDLTPIPYASAYDPHGLAVGDLDGDGSPDLAIADSNNGLVVLRNTAAAQPPSAPRNVTASPNLAAGVGLEWGAPASSGTGPIRGYRIYRGPASGSETLLTTVGNVLAYTDTTAANGSTGWYQVAAFGDVGEGPRSAEALAVRGTAPGAPRSPSATTGGQGISVRWTAPSGDGGSAITGYRVYRGTRSGGETVLASVGPSTTTYVDKDVAKKTTYWYRVTAVNALGEGAASAEVSAQAK